MNKFAFLVGMVAVILSLSARSERVDGRLMEPLKITVSKSQAAVGEPVTVTVTGGFVNLAVAHSPDYIIPNFKLGACFRDAADLLGENEGGLCLSTDLPLPTSRLQKGKVIKKLLVDRSLKAAKRSC